MSLANTNDRASIERIYPLDAFKRDAGRNSVATASVLHGLRIMSQPDESGRFDLVPAQQQTGEGDPEGDTAFLSPFLASDATALKEGSNAYAGPEDAGDALSRTREGKDRDYAAFVDRLIAAARSVDFKTPDGRDERLAGLRGG